MANLSMFSKSKTDLERITRILNVLAKFEVGIYADKILHKEKLPIRISRGKPDPQIKRMRPEERFTLMLEELGTSFVKFGQLLATRQDLIGPQYAAELSKLNDKMKSFPTADAKRIIEKELDKPISTIFSKFDEVPLASASIAQVHRARLKNGKEVVVKVQRPGIEETILEDIRIMHYLAYLADKNFPELRPYDPQYLVDEFERSILKELDFSREMRNAARLRYNFRDVSEVYIPKVYEDLSAKRVLTIEEIKGTKLSEVIGAKSGQFNKPLIARRLLHAYLHMILVDGFYHADPHPGNVLVINKKTICFIDFGRCASIDRELAENILRLVVFAIKNDVNGLLNHLYRTNLIAEGSDTKNLKADLTDLLDTYYSPNPGSIKIGQMLTDLLSIITRYDFNRPRELAELTRTLLILEGVGMQLDSHFNVAEEFQQYSSQLVKGDLSPKTVSDIIRDNLVDFQYLAKDFPGAMKKFMNKMSEGKIVFQMEHKNLDAITANFKDMSDRLSVSLVIAALIVASSVIVVVDKPLGLAFFVVTAAFGIWLVLKTLFF